MKMEAYRVDVKGPTYSGLWGFYVREGNNGHSFVLTGRSSDNLRVNPGAYFENVFIKCPTVVKKTPLKSESFLEVMVRALDPEGEPLFYESVAKAAANKQPAKKRP